MIDWLIFGVVDGDFCNDFLTPPHMWWWLGKAIGSVIGCWGNERMLPLLLVVIALAVWHVSVARKHLRREGAK